MTIADRIKLERQAQGITQDELAKKMGYSSKSAVSRTENAGDNIGQKRIREFANALGISELYLMGWIEDKEKEMSIEVRPDNEEHNKKMVEIALKYYNAIMNADKKTRDAIDSLLEIKE